MKHPHAELMLEYAKDAMETDKPWERWEFKISENVGWQSFTEHCTTGPSWDTNYEYRRKPKPYEPTLLDQALELEIEAARLRLKAESSPQKYFELVQSFGNKLKSRTPAMIEHLKSQGKL